MSKQIEWTRFARRSLAILPVLAALLIATQPGTAEARDYRASLTSYCKQFNMSRWGYYPKYRQFRCQRISMGFNTTYVSKTRAINLSHLCRQQYRTSHWRYRGRNVYCIRNGR